MSIKCTVVVYMHKVTIILRFALLDVDYTEIVYILNR